MRFFILIILIPFICTGQVINDDIQQALRLELGEPLSSSTAYCTIQSSCVNYALTKTCLKYHNDQWFIINSGNHKFLYLNIKNQECRDLMGVQMVVLKGEPCDVKNYQLEECISLASNDDFYVRIDDLEPETDYLINIDGYLHDYCSFDIFPDTVPHGLPQKINLELSTVASYDSSYVQIKWNPSDSLQSAISSFEILKRDENTFKHTLKKVIPVQRNAYGAYVNEYTFNDTINQNLLFYYKIVAVDLLGKKHLFDERVFRGMLRNVPEKIDIRLTYPIDTPLAITIYAKDSGEVFRKVRFSYDPVKHKLLQYPVISMVQKGIKTLVVEILNEKNGDIYKKEYRLQ